MKIVIGERDLTLYGIGAGIYLTPSFFVTWAKGTVHDLDEDVIKEHIEIEFSFDFLCIRSLLVIHIMY